MAYRVEVEGLDDLRRELNKVQKGLGRALTREIKEVAKIVSEEARRRAIAQDLGAPGRSGRGTGQLVKKIKPFARGTTGGVKSSAQRNGFPYPVIYEFAGTGRVGPRPHLYPALEAKADAVQDKLEDGIDRLLRSLD